MSTNGRREAQWAAMQVAVVFSSAIPVSSIRLRRVQRPRVPVVQQTRELLSFRVAAFHRRLERCFLDIARHLAPDVHHRLSEKPG
jgi:hypothetical protein